MPIQKTTKKEIIATSYQVFRRQGYHRTTLEQLAQATGLTKGVFYHHFKNKEAIMQEVLRTSHSYFSAKVFSIAYQDEVPARERMQRMIEASNRILAKDCYGCIFANTALEINHIEEEFAQFTRDFFEDWEKAFTHILESEYQPNKAQLLAQQIIADIEGSLILMQVHQDKGIIIRAYERTMKHLE